MSVCQGRNNIEAQTKLESVDDTLNRNIAYKRIHIELFKSVLRVVINNAIDLKYS